MPKYKNPLPEGVNRRDYQDFLYYIERTDERLRDRDRYTARREELPSGEIGIGLYRGTACLGKWFMTSGAIQGDRQNKRAFWNIFKKCENHEEVYAIVSKHCFYWESKCDEVSQKYNGLLKKFESVEKESEQHKYYDDSDGILESHNRYLNLQDRYIDLLREHSALMKEKTDNLLKSVSDEQEPEKETTAPDCEPGSIEAMCRSLSEDRTGAFCYSENDVSRNIDLLIVDAGMIPGQAKKRTRRRAGK